MYCERLVRGFGVFVLPLFLYTKVAATKIGLRHFLQVWLSMLQHVQRFSFFCFSTNSSLIPLWAFFQWVCSSFDSFLFFTGLVQEDFHLDPPFPCLLAFPFLSTLVLNPFSGSSRFRLGRGASGVVRDLVNFSHSVSSSSYLPTLLKISIHSSSELKLKWDRRSRISLGSLLSTRTL